MPAGDGSGDPSTRGTVPLTTASRPAKALATIGTQVAPEFVFDFAAARSSGGMKEVQAGSEGHGPKVT